jgi:hypothetical protein
MGDTNPFFGMWLFVFAIGIVAAALLATIPSKIAAGKGRSEGLWWLYGFFLFPIAFLHSLFLDATPEAIYDLKRAAGYKYCPQCHEFVHTSARICPHCHRDPRVQVDDPDAPRFTSLRR